MANPQSRRILGGEFAKGETADVDYRARADGSRGPWHLPEAEVAATRCRPRVGSGVRQ
jgi:hypothetical protein